MYNQIWLNLPIDDHHFGYIERQKKPGHILRNTISCIKQLSITPHTSPPIQPQLEMTNQTMTKQHQKRHKKMTQNAHKLLCGSRKSKKRNPPPPPILGGVGGGVGGGTITRTYRVLNCLGMEHAQNGKQKMWETLLGKEGLQEKQSGMNEKERRRRPYYYYYPHGTFTRVMKTVVNSHPSSPAPQRYLTHIFFQVSKKPFLT